MADLIDDAINTLSGQMELDRLRSLACDLQLAEAAYRRAHDLHGDGSRQAGRAWDLMRRAGDKVRRALGGTDAGR